MLQIQNKSKPPKTPIRVQRRSIMMIAAVMAPIPARRWHYRDWPRIAAEAGRTKPWRSLFQSKHPARLDESARG